MKKFCLILAALMFLMGIPAVAEDVGAEMAQLLEGDWVHEESSEYRLLFDGVDKFYYDTDESFYYGYYAYVGDGEYVLLDDVGDERVLSIYDDMSLSLEGIEGYFYCNYAYCLMDYPNTDEGTWLNDDGVTRLLLALDGEFELENDEIFYYGEYAYMGDGDYQLTDDEGSIRVFSLYDDGSIGLEGFDGYFWLQDDVTGYDPFEDIEDDEDFVEAPMSSDYDSESLPLSGTWYKNGDVSTIPFVLEEGAYSCENSVFGSEVTGTWTLDEIVLMLTDGETDPATFISMENDDGMPAGWNPVPMAGNRILYSNVQDTYFLHESLIGTDEGEMLGRMADFMCADWCYAEEGTTMYLEFTCVRGAVVLTTWDEDGESVQEIVGSWVLQDGGIEAVYIDGSTASYALPAETIVVDGLEFTK